MYYNGEYAETYFYSCNGGASEDAENVWGREYPYLKGKADPYEANVASRISKYNWSTTFTQSELTSKLASRGWNIGTVQRVYVSQFTPSGNVGALTFVGSSGSKTVYRETCRTLLGLRSMRFTTSDTAGGTGAYCVNNAEGSLSSLSGAYTISGGGAVSQYAGAGAYVITSGGVSELRQQTGGAPSQSTSSGTFVFTGSGWGHNVGMSQWGAIAMAEMGYSYRDILEFYFTGVEVR